MLTITGPGPVWASPTPAKHNPRWKPQATDYADFARAVATRYGTQVDRYLIWNEPNQQGWLQPQWQCDKPRTQLHGGLAARLPLARARGRRRRSTPPTRARRS